MLHCQGGIDKHHVMTLEDGNTDDFFILKLKRSYKILFPENTPDNPELEIPEGLL